MNLIGSEHREIFGEIDVLVNGQRKRLPLGTVLQLAEDGNKTALLLDGKFVDILVRDPKNSPGVGSRKQ